MNDSFENNPGRGGVVTPDWIERYADEVSPDPYVIRLVPGADVDQFARNWKRQQPLESTGRYCKAPPAT